MKPKKQPNYLRRLTQALQGAQIPPGYHNVKIRHDSWCAIFRGGACNCDPEIELPFPGKN